MSNYKYFVEPIKAKCLYHCYYFDKNKDGNLSFEPLQLGKMYNIIGEYLGCQETYWVLENNDLCSKDKMEVLEENNDGN